MKSWNTRNFEISLIKKSFPFIHICHEKYAGVIETFIEFLNIAVKLEEKNIDILQLRLNDNTLEFGTGKLYSGETLYQFLKHNDFDFSLALSEDFERFYDNF